MPNYEIIIIRHRDVITRDDEWLQTQLREERWIGASQWARLQWLYEQGGFYVDMDVEAIRSFDDLRHHAAFFGVQKDGFVNNAVMGAVAGHPFFAEQMAYIKTCDTKDPQFGNETGPRMVTKLLQQHPRRNVMVYPPAVFYPYHWNERFTPACVVPETIAVHHWAASWCQDGF
jgi:mannosyltransferase OCH1-like enzyme